MHDTFGIRLKYDGNVSRCSDCNDQLIKIDDKQAYKDTLADFKALEARFNSRRQMNPPVPPKTEK